MKDVTPPNFIIDSTGRAYDPSAGERFARLEILAEWMDTKFTVPGTNFRFGLDPILGLLPGIGDTASFFVSAYIVMEAQKLDISTALKYRMIWNIFLDLLVGSIPVLGDLFDASFKANRKNISLLRTHMGRL